MMLAGDGHRTWTVSAPMKRQRAVSVTRSISLVRLLGLQLVSRACQEAFEAAASVKSI